MQSITLLALAGFLLVTAFLISQQTQSGEKQPGLIVTPRAKYTSLEDMPDCSGELTIQEAIICFNEAAQVSESLVMSLEDALVDMEADTARQVALIESQIVWAEARDFECDLVRKMAGGNEGVLKELVCQTELNLSHLTRLERYRNDWYGEKDPENKVEVGQ